MKKKQNILISLKLKVKNKLKLKLNSGIKKNYKIKLLIF